MFRSYLPDEISGMTDAFVFGLIALLFIVRPQGFFNVTRAERV
jgi:branched-subunit amino acid ABC-type transport system permease component